MSTEPTKDAPWTEEDTVDAARQWRMGASFKEIGLSLNRKASSVHGHLSRRGLLSNKPSIVQRNCLCCGRLFNSSGPNNRMCGGCRSKPDPGDAMRYV